MARPKWMMRFARWHIWLGWLVGVPVLMWMVTGLVMVARPIEEVRGEHLRKDVAEQLLNAGNPAPIALSLEPGRKYREMRVVMQRGRPVWLLTREDGRIERHAADRRDEPLPEVDQDYVRDLVAERIVGGEHIYSIAAFDSDEVPFDFRRQIPVWQVTLEDGTNIYVGRETGDIEAVRTRYWRVFDFMWGLHIMDLQTREDTSHPILILFAFLGCLGALLGCILMFRRRKARVQA